MCPQRCGCVLQRASREGSKSCSLPFIFLGPCGVDVFVCVHIDGMSGVGQLLLENEKTKRKLRKVQQRRDYYARQYFQTLSQLEQVRAELAHAVNTIRELTGRGKSQAWWIFMSELWT